MRRFVLQMEGVRSGASFELEAKHLDTVAKRIAELVECPATIRHDRREFTIYVGPHPVYGPAVLIKRPRIVNALHWGAHVERTFCITVVNEWLKTVGRPQLPAPDGNRLCTTIEESGRTAGGVLEPINRSG